MSEAARRISILEQQARTHERAINNLWAAIYRLEGQLALSSAGGGGSGSGTGVYYIDPVVISAGGNVTGKTVYYLVGGTPTTITTNGTIYNQMAAATVSTAGKTIVVGPNGDGTYLAISQSC